MAAVDALQRGLGKANDALAAQFLPNVTVTLCKPSDTADEFVDVLIIESKWFFEYSNFRKNFLLEIADDSDALTDAIAEATHVQVDDTYYVIIAGDTMPPAGTNPVWRLYCDLFERRGRYATL